ncbi:MAG: phosphoribosylformylglycinamidine cyclo-ligase [Candidatus Norongarragalinales archaeon]
MRLKKRESKAREFTYAAAGVDRAARARAKKFGLLEATLPSGWRRTPFNNLVPLDAARYCLLTVDGVGTKILVAQLAQKLGLADSRVHENIGVDAIAMVANDCVRCGARPIAFADTLDACRSEPTLISAIARGLARAAREAGAPVAGGETADVRELVRGLRGVNAYSLNASCFGVVERSRVIDGSRIRAGDAVVGLRSSGFHANGFSLARRVLFKEWGGLYDAEDKPKGLKRALALELLAPTRIYVKNVLAAVKEFEVRGAVHVTGDAYAKFLKLTPFCGCGFEFNNFKPQPVFGLIQSAAEELGGAVFNAEMFRTFNMGWGFALIVPQKQADSLCSFLKRHGENAEVIGAATKNKSVAIRFQGEKIVLR